METRGKRQREKREGEDKGRRGRENTQGEEGGRRPREKRQRKAPRQEKVQWKLEELAGGGGWVDVWLERSVQGEGDQG